jgi:hypothetical protein
MWVFLSNMAKHVFNKTTYFTPLEYGDGRLQGGCKSYYLTKTTWLYQQAKDDRSPNVSWQHHVSQYEPTNFQSPICNY